MRQRRCEQGDAVGDAVLTAQLAVKTEERRLSAPALGLPEDQIVEMLRFLETALSGVVFSSD